MSKDLRDRIYWTILQHRLNDPGILMDAIIAEIESSHRIVDPYVVTDEMFNACFGALPEHYDPPNMKRRAWHAYKARHRFTAMVLAVKKVLG